ncbi:MAG: hypothetical protein JOZ38_05430, partial [Candidatus Eremiobacteraeota bacterium]|nr:hypothetical protein [Candidatus Eremiobacteraeota bacterium]
MPTKRRFWVIVSIVAMLALALLERRAVVGFMLSTGLSVVTGYGVSIGEMRVTRSHAALFDVHVTHGVDPVLDADRIDVYYNLRDLFPGSAHRFGLLGVTIDRPRITVVRRPDGSYNISTGPGRRPIAAPGQTRVNGTPLEYYARVRNGSAVLVDASSYYADGRRVELRNIDANLSVKSDARTHYVVSGAFVDVKDQPFKAVGTVDYNRGYALHHITASALPMRALANFFINSPAAHVLAGTTRDLDASIFALGLQPGLPVNYHLSARARVNDAQIYVKTLAQPVDHIHGVVQVFDGGFAAKELGATIAGIPLRIAGGIYDFNDPKFRLGIEGTGDMRAFKSAITFARTYPLAGPMHLRVLVEGTINDPVLLIGFRSPRMWYDRIPLDRLNGVASIFGGNVDFIPLSVTYSGIGVDIHGTMDITGRSVKSKVELHFDSDASNVPYLRALIGHEPVTGDILLDGVDTNFVARGYLADPRNLPVFSGFFSLSPQGYGQIGPMWMRAPGGGSLVLAYILDRPRGDSAFWLSAHGVRLSQANEDAFPGLQMPILPLDRGYIVSADLAGGGSGHAVSMAGTADIHRLVVSHFPIGDVRADFGGTLDHLDMPRIDARGTWGRMRAQAAFVNGTFAVHGDVDGDLAALQPYMGGVSARGKMHGPIALAVAGNDIVVQAHGTQLERASLSGIPIEAFDGTLAVEGNRVRIYSAKAQVGGAHTVAAGTLDPGRSGIAVSTADAGPPLLATLGVPLEEGRIVAAGTFGESAGAPSFAGNVALESARAAGVPVAGSAMIDLRGDAVRMTAATGVLGAVFGRFDGSVGALRSGQPAYDLQAHVPVAEIGDVVSALHVPGYAATGSFSANFHVGGAGTQPQITGPVEIPVGNVNGLGFGDARAQLSASPSEIRVEHGSVLVGTTRTQVNASAGLSSGTSSVAVFAAHADLSDFNDFCATGDTLAGRGNVALAFFRTPTVFRTAGDVDVADFRYRRLPIGDTDADWSGANN